MQEAIRTRRTSRRHIAIAWELLPIVAPAAGAAVFLASWAAYSLTPLPEDVFILPLFVVLMCLIPFGFGGIGWMYIGETTVGVTILLVRGVGMLAFAYVVVMGIACDACGITAFRFYVGAFVVLGAVGAMTPILSAIALAMRLRAVTAPL
jgi:hypothetical protein